MSELASAEESAALGYVPTYYPGTPDPARASTITVKPGDEIPSVDMILQRVAAYRIRGRLYNMITHRPGKNVSIMMQPRNSKLAWTTINFETIVEEKDGSFVLNPTPIACHLPEFGLSSCRRKRTEATSKRTEKRRPISMVTLKCMGFRRGITNFSVGEK
jgi:hypothetical protein